MAKTDEITELDELAATKVSGVGAPANGTRFIVLKASDDNEGEKDCPTCKGKGTILDGNRDCPDCSGSGTVAKADDKPDEEEGGDGAAAEPDEDAEKALSAKDRDAMPASSFAYIDKDGGKHLPIHDEGHVRAAMGRLSQQDFSNAKGDPATAKTRAARKIRAAAKKHGIDVSSDSDIATAAKMAGVSEDEVRKAINDLPEIPAPVAEPAPDPVETAKAALEAASTALEAAVSAVTEAGLVAKSPGVPDGSTDVPLTVAKIPSGQSDPIDIAKLTPATSGLTDGKQRPTWEQPDSVPGVTEPLEGGESAYTIPLEAKADLTKQEEIITVPGISWAVASLSEAIQKIGEQRAITNMAVKAGLTVAPPKPEESAMPGDMPWENYDSATAAQIAGVLAEVCAAVECLINREQMEATTVDPSDAENAYDLQSMQQAVQYALGIVAQFSFTEAAEATKELEDGAEKAGRRLSGKTENVLRAARDHLTSVIGDGDESDSSEEDIMAALTKEELGEAIVTAYEKLEAQKNANNGGDISEGELHANGEIDEDLNLAGKPSGINAPGYGTVGKSEEGEQDLEAVIKAMGEQLATLGDDFQKFLKQPRRGVGPLLHGTFPAGEGREGDAAKAGEDTEIVQLREQFAKAQQIKEQTGDGSQLEQAGQALTLRLLERMNSGQLTP